MSIDFCKFHVTALYRFPHLLITHHFLYGFFQSFLFMFLGGLSQSLGVICTISSTKTLAHSSSAILIALVTFGRSSVNWAIISIRVNPVLYVILCFKITLSYTHTPPCIYLIRHISRPPVQLARLGPLHIRNHLSFSILSLLITMKTQQPCSVVSVFIETYSLLIQSL